MSSLDALTVFACDTEYMARVEQEEAADTAKAAALEPAIAAMASGRVPDREALTAVGCFVESASASTYAQMLREVQRRLHLAKTNKRWHDLRLRFAKSLLEALAKEERFLVFPLGKKEAEAMEMRDALSGHFRLGDRCTIQTQGSERVLCVEPLHRL